MISFEPLKKQLKERQISLSEFERQFGIAQTTLSQILLGKILPRVDVIESICNCLSCDINDVIIWVDGEYKKNKDKIEFVDVNWEKLCNIISTNKTSLGKLSQSLGRSYAFLSNAKQRKSKVRQEELTAICKILNCSKEDLIS